MTANNTIDEELKQTINQSILNYLHRSGFTKTLKRFQSESKIQSDTWKTSSDHLEDIYSKYVNASRPAEDNVVVEPENKQDLASSGETEEVKVDAPKKAVEDTLNEPQVNETKKKDKKKKSKSNQQDAENGDFQPAEVKEDAPKE
nr:suppressor protein SRP40 [Tanacetum cinerariifolium]